MGTSGLTASSPASATQRTVCCKPYTNALVSYLIVQRELEMSFDSMIISTSWIVYIVIYMPPIQRSSSRPGIRFSEFGFASIIVPGIPILLI